MQVLLEKQERGFRASAPPLGESFEATTRSAALEGLCERIQTRLQENAEWVELDIPFLANSPSTQNATNTLKDDPTFDEWQEIIAENRRKRDTEEGCKNSTWEAMTCILPPSP
jgi:hypothetical protein